MSEKKTTKKTPHRPRAGGETTANPMDLGLLEQIIKLMAANDLNTVDVRDGTKRVILKRGPVAAVYAAAAAAPSASTLPARAAAPEPAADPAPAAEEPGVPIKSPMVGTFYISPKPGEKAFVAVGSRVVKDETDVCIIEAMKTFNVLKADVSGTIVKILVGDGQSVQFDQPMFLVKPA